MALSVSRGPFLRFETAFPDGPYCGLECTRFTADAEHLPNLPGFLFVYDEFSTLGSDVVAQYRTAADPLTLAPGSRKLVARPFTDNLSFELREGQKDVQRQASQ